MIRVVLIGFMGSGKSTLGKRLAKRLNVTFIDSDAEIENRYGKSIGDIFTQKGESYFREIESNFIDSMKEEEGFVLATGGGMPCFGKNMLKLKALGTTIYLERSAKELAHRLINAKSKRPLLEGLSEDELLKFIEDRLHQREEIYRSADVILPREDQNVDAIQQLMEILQPQ